MSARIASIALMLCCLSACTGNSQNILQYLDAVGGKERWEAISSLKVESTVDYFSKNYNNIGGVQDLEVNQILRAVNSFGKYYCKILSVKNGSRKLVYDGKKMKESTSEGFAYEVDDNVIEQYKKREIHFGEPWLALKADSIKYLGEESESQIVYEVYKVIYLGLVRKYFIERNSHLLHKVSMFNDASVTILEDYKSVNGYLIPFTRKAM